MVEGSCSAVQRSSSSVPRLAATFTDAVESAQVAHPALVQQHPSDDGKVGSDEYAQHDVAGHRFSPGGACNAYRAIPFGSVKPADCKDVDQGSTPMILLPERQQQASGVRFDEQG